MKSIDSENFALDLAMRGGASARAARRTLGCMVRRPLGGIDNPLRAWRRCGGAARGSSFTFAAVSPSVHVGTRWALRGGGPRQE